MAQPDLDFIGKSVCLQLPEMLRSPVHFLPFVVVLMIPVSISGDVFHWTAPEVQTQSTVSAASDMFSLGLVVAAIFNRGRPLIQANHSNPNYTKQMEMVRSPERSDLRTAGQNNSK